MKEKIFAVIAAKDESKHISDVVKDTKKYVDRVIVVDDGSVDSTKKAAESAGATVLRHLVNLGKGAALKTGCEYALSDGADIIILLDADGQHEPKEIPKFISKLRENDIVFGSRKRSKNMPVVLRFGNWILYAVTRILFNMDIQDSQSGFRAFRKEIYPKIRWRSSNYSVESEMIAKVGKERLKYSEITINTIYSDKYKGTTIIDGIKILGNMLWWKIANR